MRRSGKFWNREYKKPKHLAISTEPSSDLQKFTRWFDRRNLDIRGSFVLDLGCGNGRNLIWLAREFGVRGVGYDSSSEAIQQAKQSHEAACGFFQVASSTPDVKEAPTSGVRKPVAPLNFEVRSLAEPILLADSSVDLVLDLMSSHVLRQSEREKLRDEIARVLKPEGWFCFKSFFLEGDLHAKRLLREHPADEPNSYIHPTFNHLEHVWTVEELEDFFLPQFEIHKIEKSHKHLSHGKAFRRRTVAVYLRKKI